MNNYDKIQMCKRSLESFKKNVHKSPYIPEFIRNISKTIHKLENEYSPINTEGKICTKCDQYKLNIYFQLQKTGKNKRRSNCNNCVNEYQRNNRNRKKFTK